MLWGEYLGCKDIIFHIHFLLALVEAILFRYYWRLWISGSYFRKRLLKIVSYCAIKHTYLQSLLVNPYSKVPWFPYLLDSQCKSLLGIYRFQVTRFHNSCFAGIISLPGICQTHSNLWPSHTHFRRVAHSFSGHQCDSFPHLILACAQTWPL